MFDYYDPIAAQEAEEERREQEYSLLVRYATCSDCARCQIPDDGKYKDPDVAWCPVIEDFIYPSDSPLDEGCDDFDPRPDYDYHDRIDDNDYDAMQRKAFCYHPGV